MFPSPRWSVIVVILLVGALSRALNNASYSFGIDEGFTFHFVQSPDLVEALSRDVHPPLYFAALRLWSAFTGHSELALRWFSLLPSMLSLALIFQVAKELARARSPAWDGAAVPTLAMLMLALADAEIFLAQEARHYTLLVCLVLGSMLNLMRWLRRSLPRDYLAWLLCSILMFYTHYVAVFALAVQGLYSLIWSRGKIRRRALSALTISALAMAPWLLAVGLEQLGNPHSYGVWWPRSSVSLLVDIGLKYFTRQWALIIGLLALGCVTLIYRRADSFAARYDRLTPLLLLWLIVPFCLTVLFNEFIPILLPHRLTQWTPAIALLVACGLGNIRQPVRTLIIAALVIYGLAHYDFYYRHHPDWRQIARMTTRYAVPGDLILTDVASGDYPLRYYILRNERGSPSLEDGLRFESLEYHRLYQAETYESWLPRLLDGHKTVWLMYWSSDESAFTWLEVLNFKRSAQYVYRHDGGARGESLLSVYRYDRALEYEPVARFANGMVLRSAHFDRDDLRLDTLWETARPLERDYLLSAKLLDSNGRVAAQHDSQPQSHQRPTSGWLVGEFVYSPHEMKELSPIVAGDYQVIAQVYTMDGDGFKNVPTAQSQEYAVVAEIPIDGSE